MYLSDIWERLTHMTRIDISHRRMRETHTSHRHIYENMCESLSYVSLIYLSHMSLSYVSLICPWESRNAPRPIWKCQSRVVTHDITHDIFENASLYVCVSLCVSHFQICLSLSHMSVSLFHMCATYGGKWRNRTLVGHEPRNMFHKIWKSPMIRYNILLTFIFQFTLSLWETKVCVLSNVSKDGFTTG